MASGIEPSVRIGVVLAEDGQRDLQLRLPGASFALQPAGGAGRALPPGELRATLQEGAVALSIAGAVPLVGRAWSIAPTAPQPLRRGEGVLARGIVAGRGFHWHKRVDQTLTGALEILPGDGGLVLVNELPLEAYLAGVITSEMSGDCPVEFLRAQCIAARSWLLAFTEPKHDAEPFDRCNDDCCQRYQGTGDLGAAAAHAVDATRGRVLVAEGRVVDANYSKSCGGIVETPEHVWGIRKPGLGALVDAPAGSDAERFLPVTEESLHEYLDGDWPARAGVFCSPAVAPEETLGRYLGKVDESGRYFRWTVRQSHDDLRDLLRSKEPPMAALERLDDLRVTRRGVSGRATEVEVDWRDAAGEARRTTIADQYRIRRALHPGFLFSSAFAVTIERDALGRCLAVTLRGAGWGHGAGLCQIGALGMALRGHDAETILRHYFPGSTLQALYA